MQRVRVIDSHTGGEPTRIIVDGGPDLGCGSLAERAARFSDSHDSFRNALIGEPRGNEILVGGLLCEPDDPQSACAVIFFDNAGLLGMCGHGTIGLAVTLNYLGRLPVGAHQFETPVGKIDVELLNSSQVSFQNINCFRDQAGVKIEVDGFGTVTGDIVWSGNWFFLTHDSPYPVQFGHRTDLLEYCKAIRKKLKLDGIVGSDDGAINHVEVCELAGSEEIDGRNFVLCPGGAFDRSPCGTGTSAHIACLAADSKLLPGQVWRQQGIVGSIFEASYQPNSDGISPTIKGRAFVTAESTMILNSDDPYCYGIS